MAELQDLIDQIKEGNDNNRDHLNEIERHSRNSRRHLLETKKEIIGLAANIAQMADVPEPPTEGEQTEQRREDRKFQEKQHATLEKIAAGIAGLKPTGGSTGGGGGNKNLLGMLGLGGAAAGLGAMAGGLLKSAGGLVAMGVAIPAFFAGLLVGDKAISWLGDLGADFDYTSLKKAALGFADMIQDMDIKAFAVLGSIMAIGVVGGPRAALGIGAMGAGIAAFFGGLLLGDALIGAGASMGWLDLNFTALGSAMAGISNAIENLTVKSAVTLAAIIGAGGVAALFTKKPTDVGTGIAAIGAGISGLFIGLAVGDAAMSWLGSDYSAIAKAMTGFDNAVKNLSVESITALGAILGAGMAIGALTDESTKAKMVTGVAALTAGIVAFFGGFAVMDAAAKKLGEGDSARKLIKNFTGAIKEIDEQSMYVLGGLMGIGALFGAVPGGLAAATGASVGMGLIGAGIAAFFLAFEGMAAVGDIIGLDGSNTKKLITNMSDGLKTLTGLDGDSLMKLGNALPGIGLGIGAFFAADALGSISQTVKDGFAWLFGTSEDDKFKKIAIALKPLEDIDPETTAGLNSILNDLERVSKVQIDSNLGKNIKKFAEGLADGMPDLEFALYGGTIGTRRNKVQIRGLANGGQDLQIAVEALNNLQAAAQGTMMSGNTGGGNTTVITNNNGGGGTTYASANASSTATRPPQGIGID